MTHFFRKQFLWIVFTINFMTQHLNAQNWRDRVNIETGLSGLEGTYTQLIVANGFPAMFFSGGSTISYMRALDSSGTAWSDPIYIDFGSSANFKDLSAQVINGFPAITYFDQIAQDLRFVRALDSSGTIWASPITLVASGNVGAYSSLEIVNGNPAISYYISNPSWDLMFIRSLDAAGTVWSSPVTVDTTGSAGQFCCLKVVNGNPAISYRVNYDLKYIQAADPSGSTWNAPVIVDASMSYSGRTSMEVVNGNPAIVYTNSALNRLTFIRSNDINGVSWASPVQTTQYLGAYYDAYTSLQVVNGNPAISFYDPINADLKYIRASNTLGSIWPVSVVLESPGITGKYTSMKIVQGNPAITYRDESNGLKYIRANDISGTSWGTPFTFLTQAETGGEFISLEIVEGNPAVCFNDYANTSLRYTRAVDSLGTDWVPSIILDDIGYPGETNSMYVVNNKPAISYYTYNGYDLKYIRANDSLGSSWGTPVIVDATGVVGPTSSLNMVSGFPSISYLDATNGNLKFVRALDAFGNSWNNPINVDTAGSVGDYSTMIILGSYPAIAYYDNTGKNLKFVCATDSLGSAWASPVFVDTAGNVGWFASMHIVNGNPAIAYFDDTNFNLKYVRALDSTGISWNTPVTVDTLGDVGRFASLDIINGNPAISYFDNTNDDLKYVRAADVSGTVWSTPEIAVSNGNAGNYGCSLMQVGSDAGIAFNNGGPYFILRGAPAPCVQASTPVLFSADTVVCAGSSATLSITSGNLNDASYWLWHSDFCDGPVIGLGTNINIIGTSNTTYYVRGSGACLSPDSCGSITVTVIPELTVESVASPSSSVCSGIEVTLTGSGADSYAWSGGVIDGIGFVPDSTNTYTLTGTTWGCTDTTTLTVYVNNPDSTAWAPIVCSGESVNVASNTYSVSGKYVDVLTSVLTGCDSILTTNLTVLTPITNSFSIISPICGNNDGSVTANPGGGSGSYYYYWNSGEIANTVTGLSGMPIDTLIVTIYDSTETDCQLYDTVYVNCTTGLDNIIVLDVTFNLSPNPSDRLFTVLIDGQNRVMDRMQVYNILGEKIFEKYNSDIIDLIGVRKGMYQVNCFSEGRMFSQKIIIK